MGPMDFYVSYGVLWVPWIPVSPIGFCRSLWVSVGSCVFLYVAIQPYGSLCLL